MAKFDREFYAPAAAAVVAHLRSTGETAPASNETEAIRGLATTVSTALPEGHVAQASLGKVVKLRPSIARRFISLLVTPLMAAPVRKPKSEPAATTAAKAAQSASRKAARAAQPVQAQA